MQPVSIAQILLGAILIVLVLMQQRGTALGGAFGGSSEFYGTKRGAEKVIFRATIVVAILFFGLAIANVLFLHK